MNTLIISGGNIEVDFALEVLKKPFDQIIGVDGGLFRSIRSCRLLRWETLTLCRRTS